MRITRNVHEGNNTIHNILQQKVPPENADIKENKLKEASKYVKT
jgi:hypothetical protein